MRNDTSGQVGSILFIGQRTLDTGLRPVVSSSTSVALFNPVSLPIPTTHVKTVRSHVYLAGANCSLEPAVQFSTNGVGWNFSPESIGNSVSSNGWNTPSSPVDIFGLSVPPRPFARFGVLATNFGGSGSDYTQGAMVRMIIEIDPVPAAALPIPYRKVFTLGSTVNGNFIPFTGAVPTDGITELRTSLEFVAGSGDIKIEIGYQESDEPDEPTRSNWGTPTVVGSTYNNPTVSLGTEFDSMSLTKRYMRLGVIATNKTGGAIEAALVGVRFEVR